jgi:uncharacterized membrane protein YgdD (TMEM256/DUF423 family)
MIKLDKIILITASLLGAITVIIGAFGAHGLKQLVDAEALNTFKTGVQYQMYHSLALFIPVLCGFLSKKIKKIVFASFVIGILLFSGSIYLLALKSVLPVSVSSIGFVTPLGGLSFIIGWFSLFYGILSTNVK